MNIIIYYNPFYHKVFYHLVKIIALSKKIKVILLVKSVAAEKKLLNIFKEKNVQIEVLNLTHFSSYKYSKKSYLSFEKKIGYNMSLLCSTDRGLGRGYIGNAYYNPKQKISDINGNIKYHLIYKRYQEIEKTLTKYNNKVVLCLGALPTLIKICCKKNNIKFYQLISSFYFNRYFFSNELWGESSIFRDTIEKKKINFKIKIKKLIRADLSSYFYKEFKINFLSTMLNIGFRVLQEIYILFLLLLKSKKIHLSQQGYYFFSHCFHPLKQYLNYNFLKKYFINFNEIKKKKYCLINLQLEPEKNLIDYASDFNNYYELITWISKSLPSNITLLIKEHPKSLAVRNRRFYENLISMPNVKFADINLDSHKLIKFSYFTAGINGSIINESIFYEKPVLSFSRKNSVNKLNTVFFCSNIFETKKNIEYILSNKIKKNFLNKNKKILLLAIEKTSFVLKNFLKQNNLSNAQIIKNEFYKLINNEKN